MRPFWIVTILSFAAAVPVQSEPALKMVAWQAKNRAQLADLNTPEAKNALLRDRAAWTNLFANVKPAGQIDPVVAVRLNTLTQAAAAPGTKTDVRKAYAAALLDAAKASKDADTQSMFFEQLRWCAFPEQEKAIRTAALPGAAGMAQLAADTAIGLGVGQSCIPLSPEETVAPETARKALEAAKDDEALIRALDQVGRAGDPSFAETVGGFATHTNPEVAEAALTALEAFSPDAVAHQIPAFLCKAAPANERPLLNALRRLPTGKLEKGFGTSFPAFTPTGKKIALELMGQRRVLSGLRNAESVLTDTNVTVQIAGYRMLRDVARAQEAPAIASRAFALPDGRAREEVVAALAAIAKRDGGVTEKLLEDALRTGDATAKEVAFATAPRIGGKALLDAVTGATSGTGETAENAVRALAAWNGDDACPTLFRLAASSPSTKGRKLALAGLRKKITDTNREAMYAVWEGVRKEAKDPSLQKTVDELFTGKLNVAKGKPVTTNVRHEGNRVAAHLTDGTDEPWFGHGLPAIATIDIGSVQPVDSAKIRFWYHDARTYTFTLEVSTDGKTWKKVGGNEAAPKPATASGVNLEFAATPARFVRLTVLHNTANPNAHVLELEVYRTL